MSTVACPAYELVLGQGGSEELALTGRTSER
jgi:hypothetical protein